MKSRVCTRVYTFQGVVQGVGFRPAVCRLARDAGLAGWIQNCSGTVRAAFTGSERHIAAFIDTLPSHLPPQARIDSVELVDVKDESTSVEYTQFTIIESDEADSPKITFPPDLRMCADCRSEIFDRSDRRYGYPFTTCTNCGPRFTVIDRLPYDRDNTTLQAFPLCDACRREYTDIANRRYHAESTACPVCGPALHFADAAGNTVSVDALVLARKALADGRIVALRGIGGFQLAADPKQKDTLLRLREAKQRLHKPFAVMARDIDVARTLCRINAEAELHLRSPAAPIVILDVQKNANELHTELLTPDADTIGVMLPTSPLHELLFRPLNNDGTPPFDALVMTSGNKRSEPIAISNEEALERLRGIADCFLIHHRDINLRADDSVGVVREGAFQIWRRGRGFVPSALRLQAPLKRSVLAMGAHFKNTIALGQGEEITASAHIGDLETAEAVSALRSAAEHYPSFSDIEPEAVAVDLHPDMHSTRLGAELADAWGVPLIKVQHHYAHAAACMAEHDVEECLALSFDGTGLGTDGSIWGAELLHATRSGFERFATFSPVPLPGGDAAVREPGRQLFARWCTAGVPLKERQLAKLQSSSEAMEVWKQQIEKQLNAPMSHAAGRVFDSFAAALGIAPAKVTYEGQAAIRLESWARKAGVGESGISLSFDKVVSDRVMQIDWSPVFALLADIDINPEQIPEFALSMHDAIARAAIEMLEFGASHCGCRRAALTGGVFMNRILTEQVQRMASQRNFEVLIHHHVPPNDGGIAVGQAYIAGSSRG